MAEVIMHQTPAQQPQGPTRRVVLGRLAAASAIGTTTAVAAAGAADPHVAWLEEWRVLMRWRNDRNADPDVNKDETPKGRRWSELEDLLMSTPTMTLAGMAAQAEVLADYFPPDPEDYPDGPVLTGVGVRNLSEAVRRLAGTA